MVGQQGYVYDTGVGIALGYGRWSAVTNVLNSTGSILDIALEGLGTRAEAAAPSEDAVRAFGGDILADEGVAGGKFAYNSNAHELRGQFGAVIAFNLDIAVGSGDILAHGSRAVVAAIPPHFLTFGIHQVRSLGSGPPFETAVDKLLGGFCGECQDCRGVLAALSCVLVSGAGSQAGESGRELGAFGSGGGGCPGSGALGAIYEGGCCGTILEDITVNGGFGRPNLGGYGSRSRYGSARDIEIECPGACLAVGVGSGNIDRVFAFFEGVEQRGLEIDFNPRDIFVCVIVVGIIDTSGIECLLDGIAHFEEVYIVAVYSTYSADDRR